VTSKLLVLYLFRGPRDRAQRGVSQGGEGSEAVQRVLFFSDDFLLCAMEMD